MNPFYKKKQIVVSNNQTPAHARRMVEQHMHEIIDIGGKEGGKKERR